MRAHRICLASLVLVAACSDDAPGTSDAALLDGAPADAATIDAGAVGDAPLADAPPAEIDGAPPPPCATAADYVGGAWPISLEPTTGARYCRRPGETGSLDLDFPDRTRLTFLDGSWALPGASGTYPLRLPMCVEVPGGTLPITATGSVVATVTGGGAGATSYAYTYTQPIHSLAGDDWEITLHLAGSLAAGAATITLDGAAWESGYLSLCEGVCSTFPPTRYLDDCVRAGDTLNRHRVAFSGGEVTLDTRIGVAMAGHEPSAFVHAEGILDGASFSVDEYFDLLYSPQHHHFFRNFGVLLPDGLSACGLRVENASPYDADPWPTVSVTDCDLGATGARAVTDYTFSRP
jgi:hypothetical protein